MEFKKGDYFIGKTYPHLYKILKVDYRRSKFVMRIYRKKKSTAFYATMENYIPVKGNKLMGVLYGV